MRKLLTILICLLPFFSKATHYYISATGSDANNRTSTPTPWQTISRVNSTTLAAGDTVSFHGGNTFYGTITPSQSGISVSPITFNSYGSGKATITGFTTISSWTSLGGNIWESTSSVSSLG